jgi:hypothetical protein
MFLVANLGVDLSCPVHLLQPETRIEISGFWLCVRGSRLQIGFTVGTIGLGNVCDHL